MRERLASFISGNGSTMEQIIRASNSGEIDMDIACVVSSSTTAGGIDKAVALGIKRQDILIIDVKDMRRDKGTELLCQLQDRGVTVITQNGWLPLTPALIIDTYPENIFNQHPGPVPEFGGKGMYGIRVHAAITIFAKLIGRPLWTEAVVQRVGKSFDTGAVVGSEPIEVFTDDTPEVLQQRVIPVEHQLQLRLLKQVTTHSVVESGSKASFLLPGEEILLETAKQQALSLYP